MTEKVPLTRTEELILDYVRRAKQKKSTVWLSEVVEGLEIDPREVVRSARRLEALGLLKPKKTT